MRIVTLALGIVCLFAARAGADELTPTERTWARACVTGLTGASVRQREGAAAALARLGPAAVPAIASSVSVLKTDEQWAALETALVGMGAAEALKELEKVQRDWPAAAAARKKTLMDHLKAAAIAPAAPGPVGGKAPPPSPPDVTTQVKSILDTFDGESSYSTSDPRIVELANLGRPAVSALLGNMKGKGFHSFRASAAAEALKRLLVVDDVPTVAALMAGGYLEVAPALSRLPADAVVPALLAPLAKGFHAFALVEALAPFQHDPRVAPALIAWLRSGPDGAGSSLIGSTAKFLAEADARDAIPALLEIVGGVSGSMNRGQVAGALATLGEKRGIEVLLELFRSTRSPERSYDRHEAGERLNDIAGRRIYRGSYSPGGASDGNFEEASAQFDAWWAEVKDSIHFDAARGTWVTK